MRLEKLHQATSDAIANHFKSANAEKNKRNIADAEGKVLSIVNEFLDKKKVDVNEFGSSINIETIIRFVEKEIGENRLQCNVVTSWEIAAGTSKKVASFILVE